MRTGAGSRIAAGDRLAGARGSRFCSRRPPGRLGQNWGDRACSTRVTGAWYDGKAEGKPFFPRYADDPSDYFRWAAGRTPD